MAATSCSYHGSSPDPGGFKGSAQFFSQTFDSYISFTELEEVWARAREAGGVFPPAAQGAGAPEHPCRRPLRRPVQHDDGDNFQFT